MSTSLLTDGSAPQLPRHLAETPSMKRAEIAFHLTCKQRNIMLIDGPPGTGKTTATARWASQAEAGGTPAIYVVIPERPSINDVLRIIIEALRGVRSTGTKHDMENEARAYLAEFGGLLIVDEVQNLKRTGIQELRYLHDDTQTDFAMLLSGWQAEEIITQHPDLDSRVAYRTRFTPIEHSDLPAVIADMAPWLSTDEPGLLPYIDATYAAGNMRLWSLFLTAAHDAGMTTLNHADANALIAVCDQSRLEGPQR